MANSRILDTTAFAETRKVDVINLDVAFTLDDDTTEVILVINGVQVARMNSYRAQRCFQAQSQY